MSSARGVKGTFPTCIGITLSGCFTGWQPGKEFLEFLEVSDTGSPIDNGQQVAIDYNRNFISNWHDL